MKIGSQPLHDSQFVNRKEPEFVKFSVPGDFICGILMDILAKKIDGKTVAQYVVMEIESHQQYSFNGCYQIDSKLNRIDRGHIVDIRYTGDDSGAGRNGNAMKLFDVKVSKDVVNPDLLITDADLPPALRS